MSSDLQPLSFIALVHSCGHRNDRIPDDVSNILLHENIVALLMSIPPLTNDAN